MMEERGGIQSFSQGTVRNAGTAPTAGAVLDDTLQHDVRDADCASAAPDEPDAAAARFLVQHDVREGDSASAAPGEHDATAARFVIGDHTMVAADPEMIRLYRSLGRLARTQLPILIGGESAGGKE